MFQKAGIRLEHSEQNRSELYLNLLPLLTASGCASSTTLGCARSWSRWSGGRAAEAAD